MKEEKFLLPKPRKEISHFAPYIPGRPIDEIKKRFKLKSVIKLASNENSLGCSKKINAIVSKVVKTLFRYPEGSSLILRESIAKKYKLTPEEIIVGAGSDELIELVAKTYLTKEDNIVISRHAFIRYKMAGELMGCKILEIPMKNFTHNLSAMADAANDNTKIIFIANPNNPTGTYNTHDELISFLKTLITKKIYPIVVIDEAYYEYAIEEKNYAQSLKLRKLYPNILVLRTFSKVYGLAGLRVGYGISRREIITELDKVRPPFNVSSFGQYLTLEAMSDKKHIKKSVDLIKKEKKFLYKQLEIMGLTYLKTAGNFILIDVSPYKGSEIFNELLKYGIIVRAMEEYEFPFHIRVTIGTHKENVAFINSLEQVLKNLHI
ncbi:MAG: histidinol-phosphate transaminase [Endomicrobiia bacterium]